MLASSSTTRIRGRAVGGRRGAWRRGGQRLCRARGSSPLAFQPGIQIALAEPPLASDADRGNLTGLDQPVHGPQVDLEVLQDFIRGQEGFVNHPRVLPGSLYHLSAGGELDGEHRAPVCVVGDRNLASMFLNDAIGDRESQPGPLSYVFCGVKRIEDSRQHIGRDPLSRIANPYDDGPPFRVERCADLDATSSVARHRMLCVDEDIQERLLQEQGVAVQTRQSGVIVSKHVDASHPTGFGPECQGPGNNRVQTEPAPGEPARACEDEEVPDDLGRAFGLP